MLRYFRINDPYRLLGLLILLLIIYLPIFLDPPQLTVSELKAMVVGEKLNSGASMYIDVADNTGPLSAWFHAFMDFLFGRSLLVRHIVAFLLIFLHSAYLGIIFITKKAFNETTFIPSLIFSILFFFSFDSIALTDELLGSTFLLMAMNNLFKEIEFRAPSDETTFNLGLYISFASLFHLPYMIFLFGILVMLFLFGRTNARKFLLFIFGFLLPHLLILSIYYLRGSAHEIWTYYYSNNLAFGANFLVSFKGLILLGLIPICYLLISIVMLNRLARFSKYQVQMLQSIFLWIGFCFIYFLFCKELRPQTLIVLIPPVTFLFTHLLLLIRRKKFAEMNTWILLIGIVTVSYLARYNKLSSIDYSQLFVDAKPNTFSDKTVLVLSPDRTYYVNNKPATRYVNWEIAREVFEHPEYYESISDVYSAFKNDPPDVIIDEQNLMRPFFERIPELRVQYRREGNQYVKKINS